MTEQFKIQRNMRLGRVTQLGFGTVLAMMVGIGVVSKFSMTTVVESNNWVTHTYAVKEQLRGLEKSLVDAETGQRGFLYSNEEEFLEPYNNALNSLKVSFSDLRDLINDNPEQLKRLDQVENLVQQKLDNLAETIALKKTGREQALKDIELARKGKRIMDEIRVQIGEMIGEEDKLLDKRKQDASRAEQFSTFVSVGGTGLAIALGLASLSLISRKVVRPINQITNIIASSSSEIAATIEQQERTAQEQAAAVSQASTTIDELGASSLQSTEQAEASAAGAQQVLLLIDGHAQNGHSKHLSLREQVGEIADQILRLSEQTNQIGVISTLVGDLANQTNMLALNAAVEAVRAGEHGKGFGVVATEIRKLADQSKKSAERISTLVLDIQNATTSTVMATDEGTKAVSKIVESVNTIAINSQQISLTTKQQAIAIQQVVSAMNSINQGAAQTASGISQTKVGTRKLNDVTTELKAIV